MAKGGAASRRFACVSALGLSLVLVAPAPSELSVSAPSTRAQARVTFRTKNLSYGLSIAACASMDVRKLNGDPYLTAKKEVQVALIVNGEFVRTRVKRQLLSNAPAVACSSRYVAVSGDEIEAEGRFAFQHRGNARVRGLSVRLADVRAESWTVS